MDICENLKSISFHMIDGEPFYRLRDVFDALGVPENRSTRDRATALIDSSHRRYEWQKKRRRDGKIYNDKRFCYINRKGAERLFIKYGGQIPRYMLMEALPSAL